MEIPRTPSPKVRIRSQSFDSPCSRIGSLTPIEESPFSKSSSFICTKTVLPHQGDEDVDPIFSPTIGMLQPLHTKISDESIASEDSAAPRSTSPTSPTTSYYPPASPPPSSPIEMRTNNDTTAMTNATKLLFSSPLQSSRKSSRRPHTLTFVQTTGQPAKPPAARTKCSQPTAEPMVLHNVRQTNESRQSRPQDHAPDPMLYQEPGTPMHSGPLVRTVLELHDVYRLAWMYIPERVLEKNKTQTSHEDVLDILANNGRIPGRRWWD